MHFVLPDEQVAASTRCDPRFPAYSSGQAAAPPELLEPIDKALQPGLLGVLARDPRPRYQDDPDRIYGMSFAGWEIRFRVKDGILTVTEAHSAV